MAATDFPGVAVTATLHDPRDGAIYAVLKHGHFGSKLHRSDDQGRSWKELPAPAFPADAAGEPALFQVWTIEAGGADQPGRLWVGAIPAGLFASDDRGESWQLVASLWDVPERAKWFGGGYDDAGIHSISPDPRDSRRVFVGISCGGVWETRDDGASWRLLRRRADRGLHAARAGRHQGGAGPAPRRALRGRAGHDVDPASQRHLPLDRRRRDLDPAQAARRRFRLCGRRASARSADRLVRAGNEGRNAHAARRRAGGDAHARRRQDLADVARRPAAARRLRPDLPPRARRGR